MELNFEKQGAKWVAEFKVTGDFNLHVEREEKGFLFVQQRTTPDGEYDSIKEANFSSSDGVIDKDFVGVVYPKWIKVVSEAEVTRAAVLPEGVAEPNIKLIEFYVEGTPFQAEEGMTWGEFAASKYANEEDFYVNTEDGNRVLRYQGASLRNTSRERQNAYSVIVDGEAYTKIEEE